MDPKLYPVDFPPEILARGFWLYAWKIVGPKDEQFCYVGMTGDVSGVAQSPFGRAAAHFGSNEKSNAIRKHLRKHNIEPEQCRSLTFLAYGPVLPYYPSKPRHHDFDESRKSVGALERKLWEEAGKANTMLNDRPTFGTEFDAVLWEGVHAAFSCHLAWAVESSGTRPANKV